MNFDFNDEQKMLRKAASDLLKDRSPLSRVREIMESDQPMDNDLWQEVSKQGWQAATIPEAYGGSGYGYLELSMLAYELGRSVAAIPYSSTVYFVAEALIHGGSEADKTTWLPKIATGEIKGALAHYEPTENLKTTFLNGKLNGVKKPVQDGDVADLLVVSALDKNKKPVLCLVETAASGLSRTSVKPLDLTRSQSIIEFTDTPGTELDGLIIDTLMDRAAVLIAFEQLGGATTTLKMAQAYGKERYAFGRAIGGFQAIKHKIVDMFVATELARSNCYYGAWALENTSKDLALAAAVAHVSATDAFEENSRENLQVHGGIGFTWEADPHILFRRSKSLALQLGGASRWRDRIINSLENREAA